MIYVILADGFEEIEAIEPIDIMKRAGLLVTTAGLSDLMVKGAHNISVKADILIDDINKADMELLMLPGGVGHELLDKSEKVHELIDYAIENDLYIASICAAPSILGKRELLKGKNATCFPGFEDYLIGASLSSKKAVVDGKFITARGAGCAVDFGFLIVELLKDKLLADDLKGKMQYWKNQK